MVEDEQRVAHDLHDHVIQRLFAVGLSLQALAAGLDAEPARKLERLVGDIDDTIAQVRTTIFGLRGHLGPRVGTTRARVLEVVDDCGRVLPAQPSVRFAGPVDALVGDDLTEDVVAVLREALLATGRATDEVEVALTAATDRLTVDVRWRIPLR